MAFVTTLRIVFFPGHQLADVKAERQPDPDAHGLAIDQNLCHAADVAAIKHQPQQAGRVRGRIWLASPIAISDEA
jgi:hypothetical protein